ncbi:MAG: hypothetical protein HRU29_11200 [Rhizobiales bacterium]|nr:hypothetical protein [Hyphomicrobiales bacterium]NRB14957.1 hypothetical protein [Hyphomicrobiales bacterium]
MKITRRKFIVRAGSLITIGGLVGYFGFNFGVYEEYSDHEKYSGHFELVEPLLNNPIFNKTLHDNIDMLAELSNKSRETNDYKKLEEMIKRDFDVGSVYQVNNWLLSETEFILFYIYK